MAEEDWEDVPAQGGNQGSEDDWEDVSSGSPPSPLGSGLREAARSAGSGVGAGLGMIAGRIGGAALGTLAGPAAPLAVPAGMIAGGIGGGMIGQAAEDKLLELLGMKQGAGPLSDVQQQQDIQANPKSSFAGQMLGSIGPSFNLGGAGVATRAIGGAIQGGLEAGQQAYQGEGYDPSKILIAGGMGAAFSSARPWLGKVQNAAGRLGLGDVKATPATEATPPSPDAKAMPPEEEITGEEPATEPPATPPPNPDVAAAQAQLDGMAADDPLRPHVQAYVDDATKAPKEPSGLATPSPPLKMTLGNAEAQPPPAERPDATGNAGDPDNPVPGQAQAPMDAREDARPTDPGRDYRKDATPVETGLVTQESTPMTAGDRPPDIAAAMEGPPKQPPGQAPSAKPPPEAPVETGLQSGNNAPAKPLIAPQTNPNSNKSTLSLPHRPQAEEAPPVTATETPASNEPSPELAAAHRDIDTLVKYGKLPSTADAHANLEALSPEEQTQAAAILRAKADSLARAPRTAETGVIVKSKAVKTKIETSVAAVKQAVQGAPELDGALDPSVPSDALLIEQHARQMWDSAVKGYDNKDPISKPDGYMPNLIKNRLPEHNILKAARSIAMNQNPSAKALQGYVTALQLKGETGVNEKSYARPNENVADTAAETSSTRPFHDEYSDIPSKRFLDDAGYEPDEYNVAQNNLRNWLNGLSDTDHADVMGDTTPEEMASELNNTHDPVQLMKEYNDRLTAAQVNDTAVKTTRVTNASQLKTVKTDSGSLGAQLKNLLQDEHGGMALPRWPDWMKNAVTPKPKTPEEVQADVVKTPMFAPKLPEPSQEYADALGGRFVTMRGRVSAYLARNIANSAAAGAQKLTPAENGQIMREFLQGRQGLLSGKLKDYNDTFVKPLMAQYGPMYDEARDLAQKYMPPSFSDLLPERKVDPNGIEFMPRKAINDPLAKDDNVDPVAGQQGNPLFPGADTLKPRDWFTLQNNAGQRLTYKPGDGEITIMRNGAPTKIKVAADPTGIGSTIRLKVGGKSDTWTVGNSTPDEITAAAGKNPDGTNRLEFHQDPAFLWTNANNGLKSSLEKLRLLRDVSEDPRFKALTTTDRTEAAEKGWIEPQLLTQFKGKFMPPILAHTMDDFVQRGFVMKDPTSNASWDWLGQQAQNLNKPFFFFGPLVHDFNIFNNWAVGRGVRWITPQGNRDLATTAGQAIKSVNTQDHIQDEIREAGGSLMYAHSVARNAGQQVAENLGIEIAKNPSKWDPIAKTFGTTTADMSRAASIAYQKSSNFMWHTSDYMYTQRYLEGKAQGMTPSQAVAYTEKFIMNYRMPASIFGSRFVQQAAASPQLTMFAPWHYGVINAWGHVFRDALGPGRTASQRAEAAGQFAVAAGLTLAAYPAMTAGYRAVTGDKNAEVEPRGMSALAQHALDVAQGKADLSTAARQVWTPSIPITAGGQAIRNQDYRGKAIIDQQDLTKPGNAARAAVQGTDWAARTLVPPYGQMSNAAKQRGAGALGTVGKFAEGMVGITDKSAAAQKRDATIAKIQNANAKARFKNPPGLGEKLYDYATGR